MEQSKGAIDSYKRISEGAGEELNEASKEAKLKGIQRVANKIYSNMWGDTPDDNVKDVVMTWNRHLKKLGETKLAKQAKKAWDELNKLQRMAEDRTNEIEEELYPGSISEL